MYNEIFLKSYQKETERREPFNEELLNYRRKENIYPLIKDICKSLEIIENIKFLDCEIIKEEMPDLKKKKTNVSKPTEFHIEHSRFLTIKIRFELTYKEEHSIKELKLYFPELIDGQYFLINDNKYCPVLQLVDAETYSTSNSVTLKTSLMPIVLRNEKYLLSDIKDKVSIKTKFIKLDLFRNKINIFHYYFAKFGVERTLDFFKLSNGEDTFIDISEEPLDEEDNLEDSEVLSFKISKNIYLNVWKDWLFSDEKNNSIILSTLITAFKGRITIDKIYEKDYWKRKLGSNFTKNNSNFLEKSESILSSLERLLDDTTIRNLRIEYCDKKNIYTIIRWMMINYNDLFNIDNMDLANKRLRIDEYLLYPLISKFSQSVYRMINSKNISMKKLNTIFSNIKKDFLIKNIYKSDLVRYTNNVNTFDIFTNLKGTISGPQSQLSSGSGGNLRNKSIDTSYVGRLDLTATSSNDPGSSFTVTPFCKVYNGLFFTEKPSIKTKSIKDINKED